MSSPVERGRPEERLRHAFQRHEAEEVRNLLHEYPAFRALINEPIAAFDSPAIVAYADDLAMVDVLLELGADPNQRSRWWAGGFHALHLATGAAAERLLAAGAVPDACAAAHLDRPDLLRRLLDEDPMRVHERGGDGQTPLHFAASRTIVDILLDAGADVDARDVDHRSTPAEHMLANKRGAGRYELAGYLAERGASVDIFMAAALGLTQRAREMLAGDPRLLELRTGQGPYGEQPPSSYHIYFWTIGPGRSPLAVAEQFEHADTLTVMLTYASPTQRLLFACQRGAADDARALVREHPRVVADMDRSQHRALADAAWSGDARAVSLMLELGFDPAVPGHDSGTALHVAAWDGSSAIVESLLAHPLGRALVHVRDAHHDGTPLGWCCYGSLHQGGNRQYADVARLLIQAGADPREVGGNASPDVLAVAQEFVATGGRSA